MSALNTSTEYFFLNQVSLIYSQHTADYCIISLSLVQGCLLNVIQPWIFKTISSEGSIIDS